MKTIQTFKDFDFSPEMHKAVAELGFETPTQIQLETIPQLMEGNTDFLGLAATGTGKTAAFAIPLLERMDPTAKGVQALILCPTRELAKQVSEQINLLARFKKTKALAIYGGSDYGGQLRALKEGVSIVVGTPGRIIDHLERKTLNLNHLQTVILDEADEMISMGFKEEIETILEMINQEEKHQTWLFSATMSREIRKIADQFLDEPKQVTINKQTGGAAASVTQFYFPVHEDQKALAVENLIDSVPEFHGLIFCQTKALVIDLTQSLKNHGFAADCLHGDMEQPARERAMKAFKEKRVTIMVCTDVAARGIDVKDLTHVINYSLPREFDNYIHRIGRTGRGGKNGIAWNLVNPSHMRLVTALEKVTQTKMTRANLPDASTILKLKVTRALQEFEQPLEKNEHTSMLKGIVTENWPDVLGGMSKQEIVAYFLAKTIKVATPMKSMHEEPRRRDGQSRDDRRREFRERNTKPFGAKKFGDRKFADKKFSKSRVPTFSTFAPKGGSFVLPGAALPKKEKASTPWRRK